MLSLRNLSFANINSSQYCRLQGWYSVFHSIEDYICIKFEISVCNPITHSNNVNPWNIRKMQFKEIRNKTINTIDALSYCSDKSTVRSQQLHPTWRGIIIVCRLHVLIPNDQIVNRF